MKVKRLSIVVLMFALGVGLIQADKTVKFVSNSISCGGCAGKIKNAVSALDGVSGSEVNLESKVVGITYDESKVKPEQIKEAIVAVKHTAEDYDENAVILKTASFYAKQINCGGCAGKVKKNIGAEANIISVEADPATKIVKIEYDANKTSRKNFKDYFKKFDYTVTNYYPSEKVSYARYTFEDISSKVADIEKTLKETKGVLDYTTNEKTNTLAVAYNNTLVTEEVLAENLQKNDLKLASK
ncbi:MAG: cation transporter [Dysgonamonadaceae bacterium]|jgi:copper chaperone CopZ|nr:cation transporter [Dysgonamonadaceae bacterium]